MERITNLIRRGCMIEVGCNCGRGRGRLYRPGYRWVQGWQVLNPASGNWSAEMRLRDAQRMARQAVEGST
jgi:hypothetical protein